VEGSNLEEIDIVRQWKESARRQGQLEASREDLLLVLREGFQLDVPPDLLKTIRQTTDLTILEGWFRAVARAGSLEPFRNLIHSSENKP